MSGICPNGGTTNYISTVSTLTGPEAPVPLARRGRTPGTGARLNPHRARSPGATNIILPVL